LLDSCANRMNSQKTAMSQIIAAGIPLLSPEEIEEEIRERRGEDE